MSTMLTCVKTSSSTTCQGLAALGPQSSRLHTDSNSSQSALLELRTSPHPHTSLLAKKLRQLLTASFIRPSKARNR